MSAGGWLLWTVLLLAVVLQLCLLVLGDPSAAGPGPTQNMSHKERHELK